MSLAERIKQHRTFLLILGSVLIARIVLACTIELSEDEAYYWLYSLHPDLSYFDHPAMIAWFIKIGTLLFGTTTFGVRFMGLVTFIPCATILYGLTLRLTGDKRAALVALLLFVVTPLFSIGGLMMVPDVPLFLFWCLLLWLVSGLPFTAPDKRFWAVGVLLGLGLLSKYFMVFAGLGMLLIPVLMKEYRVWLRSPRYWAALMLSGLFFVPVLLWNAEHDWASFAFHLVKRQSNTSHFSPKRWGTFLGTQFAFISPILFPLLLHAVVRPWLRKTGEELTKARLISLFGWPVLGFFSLSPLFLNFRPHWTGIGCLAGFILLGWTWWDVQAGRRWYRGFVVAAIALSSLFSIVLYAHFLVPFLPLPPKGDLTTDITGWDRVGAHVDSLFEARCDPKRDFIDGYRYNYVAQLAFYSRYEPRIACLSSRLDGFDFWQDPDTLVGRNAIYLCTGKFFQPPEQSMRFASIEPLDSLVITRRGKPLRTYYLWYCRDFRGESEE